MQASQAALASSSEALTLRLHQAQSALPRLLNELQSNQHVLQNHMRECQGWSDRHQYTVKALRDQLAPELMCPDGHWAADQAPVQLGEVKHAWHPPAILLTFMCLLVKLIGAPLCDRLNQNAQTCSIFASSHQVLHCSNVMLANILAMATT